MKSTFVFLSLLILAGMSFPYGALADEAQLIESHKIWDAGNHNAFTDLTRWKDQWWITFREATAHVADGGKIRVLSSADGTVWQPAALVEESGVDLRDPKFFAMTDGRLGIVAGAAEYRHEKKPVAFQSRVLFSTDGKTWTTPAKVLAPSEWLWRVTPHGGKYYGVAYNSHSSKGWTISLYSSDDALHWDCVAPLSVAHQPNETTLRFDSQGNMLAVVRCEEGNGVFGSASPPFTQWTWHPLDSRLGGPNFLLRGDGSMIIGTRHFNRPKIDGKTGVCTIVGTLTPEHIERLVTLPSGGDCSYPGMAFNGDELWFSYYSSHEGKTAIYFAKIKLPAAPGK